MKKHLLVKCSELEQMTRYVASNKLKESNHNQSRMANPQS